METGSVTHGATALCWNHFSFRTPLNGLVSDFTSMNRPVVRSRFVHVPVRGFLICDRPRTAPRRPGPFGGFLAMIYSFLAPGSDSCRSVGEGGSARLLDPTTRTPRASAAIALDKHDSSPKHSRRKRRAIPHDGASSSVKRRRGLVNPSTKLPCLSTRLTSIASHPNFKIRSPLKTSRSVMLLARSAAVLLH